MNSYSEKIYIVIPIYNEKEVIQNVVAEIKDAGYENIIVIDDGSSDNTYKKVKKIENVTALRHKINRGKGAAAKTGIEAAKLLEADIIVVMDGDGQHDPENIKSLISPIVNEDFDVILGSRLINPKGMPFYKIIHNKIANVITWCLYGLWVTDSQSGFRAYSANAFNVINTKADRYEYESEIIRQIYLNKLRFREVPIKVVYTDYSKGKAHKQGLINGIRTFYKMLWNLIS